MINGCVLRVYVCCIIACCMLVRCAHRGRGHSQQLKELMYKKDLVGDLFNSMRLARQRFIAGRRGLGGQQHSQVHSSSANSAASGGHRPSAAAGATHGGTAAAASGSGQGAGHWQAELGSGASGAGSGDGPGGGGVAGSIDEDEEAVNESLAQLLMVMERLDEQIGPMLEQEGQYFNRNW